MAETRQNLPSSADTTRFPGALVAAAVVAMLCLMIWSRCAERNAAASYQTDLSLQTQVSSDSSRILHLDEILTMSARMAAATGDKAWIARYNRFVPELDRLITKTARLVTSKEARAELAATDESNQHLVRLEKTSFRLVLAGRRQQASALLAGPEYVRQKAIYSSGVKDFLREIESEERSHARTVAESSLLGFLARLSLNGLVLVLWLMALWRIGSAWQQKTEKMRESEERLSTTLNSIGDGVIAVDAEEKVVLLNDVAETLTGWRTDEAVGKPFQQIFNAIHETTGEAIDSPVKRVLRNAQSVSLPNHTMLVARNGKQTAIADSCSPIRDAKGTVTGVVMVFRDVTQSKRAELELRLFRTLIDHSPDMVMITQAATGRFLDANETVLKRLGYGREEFLEMHSLDVEVGLYASRARDSVIAEIRAKGFAVADGAFRCADGAIVPTELTLVYVTQEGQDYVVSIARDVTERRQAEQELRHAQERLECMFSSDVVGMAVADAHGGVLEANDRYLDLLGFTRAEFDAGQVSWTERTDQEYVHADERALEELRQRGACTPYEKDYTRKDGSRVGVLLACTMIPGPEEHILAIIVDTTERRQAVEALRELNESLQLQFSQSPLGMVEWDTDFKVVRWNPAAEAIFGYSSSEAMGRHAGFIVPELATEVVGQVFRELRSQQGGTRSTNENVTKDGRTILCDWYNNPLIKADGTLVGVTSLVQDITSSKNLETQLVHAQKLESIGQLAAGIAHEINTPIQYIGDNTRFVKDAFGSIMELLAVYGKLAETSRSGQTPAELIEEVEALGRKANLAFLAREVPQALEQTIEGISRVTTIVRAMKEFSHPGTKDKTPTDINQAIKTTVTVARNEWKYAAEMELDFDENLPHVPCLPGDFNQVILNLIVNAAHAISEKNGPQSQEKGKISISTRLDGDWVEIRVADTGTGIPEAISSRVFDPFFTTKPVGAGSGQGLAISHSVIKDKHNGTITLETQEGRGATFIIRLPIREADTIGRAA